MMSIRHTKNKTQYSSELKITAVFFVLMVISTGFMGSEMFIILGEHLLQGNLISIVNHILFMLIVGYLQFSVFVYLTARLGQLYRHDGHRPPKTNELKQVYQTHAPSLAVLVPSYKEEPAVVRKTLLSASLMEYPAKCVVLLIDNPPRPTDENDKKLIEETRNLVTELNDTLDGYAKPFSQAFEKFQARKRKKNDISSELKSLANLYKRAADNLKEIGSSIEILNHEDDFFISEILETPARAHLKREKFLRKKSTEKTNIKFIELEYKRLISLFKVDLSFFERKRYINLSHEPNKAMNLNSYIGLMGKNVKENRALLRISEVHEGDSSQNIPDADFIITLDADSLLLNDYALKLIHVMSSPGNEKIAVAQTPYSSFPGSSRSIERIAGATTDIQYFVHQGSTLFNATFWVGANALLRKCALNEISTRDTERGFPVIRYIQDRTVIEDTESSVDLVIHGWTLFNYPERLAYSATPPDFGSLLIQRRRWANGGLIIFPKFLHYVSQRGNVPNRIGHALMGGHYLTSLAAINLGILILLWLPLEKPLRTPWLLLAMIPYLILYTRDLIRIGYRLTDIFGVYALNLLLLPVHLGGVFKSIEQIITGKRTPFGRTPKVIDRTAVPLAYLICIYGFLIYCINIFVLDIEAGRWFHALFALTNGSFLTFGILKYIGLHDTIEDLRIGLLGMWRSFIPTKIWQKNPKSFKSSNMRKKTSISIKSVKF